MTEMLILSSPPRQFASFTLSSSPPLPSMDEIVQKRPRVLRTGTWAAPIPQNATASFTSAASLLKSTSTTEAISAFGLEDNVTEEVKPAKTTKPRKALAKKVEGETKTTKKPSKPAATEDNGDTTVAEKKKTKPRAKKATEDGSEAKEAVAPKPRAKKANKGTSGADAKEKPARKPRAKKATGESQTKLSKGKVIKSSATIETKADEATKSREVNAIIKSPELDLPKAIQRRFDWTPPEASNRSSVTTASDNALSSGGLLSGQKRNGFTNLFGSYGFTTLKVESSSVPTPLGTEITRKRKLTDLVKTSILTAAAASPKEKEKAPKKKARTITDQATSAYAGEEEEELPARSAPLLQYFPLQISERSSNDGFKVPPKPRSKSPVKGASKAKKGSTQAPILLSPESAMKQVGNQDFVFGTSSQLAREDSPTLLRDLHAAMQASNQDDDPFTDSVFDSSPPRPRGPGLTTKRNLWSVASRDGSGELLDVPMIDLVDSPTVDRRTPALPVTGATPLATKSEIWHDIGSTPAAKVPDPAKAPGPIEAAIREELLSSPSGSRGIKSPKISKALKDDSELPTPKSKTRAPKSPAKSKKSLNKQMPNFAAYTDAQLAKEIASYHFKPVKKRDQMITLLERCWESKNEAILGNLSTNLPPVPAKTSKDAVPPSTQPAKPSPKRPRGRPRKESTVRYLEMDSDMPLSQARTPKKTKKKPKKAVEDISDSDRAITPSPPRRSASQMTPLPLRPSTSDMSDSPELSPGAAQDLLFQHIGHAVTSAPRSLDSINPSWHEKILLYDPIVLEDLTVWLNTGALEKVGWDGEVDPKLVKKWCESKSICCLWRENLRGGARGRY
ncbi:related to Structure-specific endonuclease subunit slx4 [Phialocephala subalpina]|uniref:Structure-specific endonuclease subunit SLX4 n=1 Tax=Phialocephala subalpina TaxID=576137 RepID=A0A1L7WRW6_9HELO|nr:related to Structure-specific endonuclease subunit slx4 [Phialocephala subalpina]